MSSPNGVRTESTRTPKASRAGALYGTERYATERNGKRGQEAIHALVGAGAARNVCQFRKVGRQQRSWMAADAAGSRWSR